MFIVLAFLEAMACGAFPVAGNIESVREWIEDGKNGLLCNPASPESLAAAIVRALDDAELRRHGNARNQQLIAERADHQSVMVQAEAFYGEIIRSTNNAVKVRFQKAA